MENRSRSEILWMAILFTLIVGFIDYSTGYEISLSVFYFGPVAFTAWYAGKRPGLLVSLLASFVWLNADLGAGHMYSHWSIPFWNTLVRFLFLAFNALLLAASRKQLETANSLAQIDPLTGLLNLREFVTRLNIIISNHHNSNPFAVVYIDLDNFKNINDNYGHLEGDRVLCSVAKALAASLRPGDVLARIGGDEFSLLLPDANMQSTKSVLEKAREHLCEIDIIGVRITCSFGAMIFIHPPSSSSEAMRLADDLMYTAKRDGKNAVYFNVFDGNSTVSKAADHSVHYGRRRGDLV
jgi:diguanylate cyclase (GGDEF)-like protein